MIPSRCPGPELSGENDLMIPGLIDAGLRTGWKCVLKGLFECRGVYQVAFPSSGPLHRNGLTSAIHYLHR